jgi:tRNA pseudouridine38-40 synthase
MNEAAACLVGQFDFTSFSKVKGGENHYVCYCYEAGWHPTGPGSTPGGVVFRIRANRFVRGMVRLVVGTLLDVGRGRLSPRAFQELALGPTARGCERSGPGSRLVFEQGGVRPGIVPE